MSPASILTDERPAGNPVEGTPVSPSSFMSLSGRGVLAIIDQGLISGSNFIISIFLARTLAPGDYGVYALTFEVFLLLTVVYMSLVLEPMSVFGASVYRLNDREYFGALLRGHAVGSVAILVLINVAAGVVHHFNPASSLADALIGVSIAGPLVLLHWMARRAFYVKLSPRGALTGSGLYFVVLMGGLLAIDRLKLQSPLSAFLLMAAGAGIASIFMLKALKPHFAARNRRLLGNEILRRHWIYGRWALASAIPGWFFSGAMYYPLLGYFSGLGEAGVLRTLMNLNSPVTQTFVAISLLSLPYASHVYHREGASSINRLARRLSLLYLGGAALYWAVLITVGAPVVRLLYGGKYMAIVGLLPLIALGSVFRIGATAQANVLRAMESPSLVCRVYCIVGIAAILAGVPLTWLYGVKGAAITFALSGVSASLIALVTLLRQSRKCRTDIAADESAALAAEPPHASP